MVRVIIIAIGLCVGACAGDSSDGTGDITPPPPSTENYLRATAFSGNVLKLESRFISYSKKANRVSIIDPLQEIELWGKPAEGFDFALALPDFQGGSLFSADRVVIMSGDEQKTFTLTNEYLHTASAIQNAAYSLASADGQSFEIIRSTGAGLWQHETFDVPWEAIDSQLTAPPQGQPVLLVTHFNDSGTRLTAFAPADGRYAIFEANSPVDSIENTASWCPGDGIGTPGDATFRSLAWDEVLQTYYAGDKSGNVYALDPAVGCMDITNRIQIAMPESLPVTQISVLAPGRLGVMQDDTAVAGSLRIVNYDGSAFNIESLVLENICDVPLGSMLLAGEYIAVMCAQESDLEIPVDTTPNPQDAWIDPRSYIIYNINSGVLINQATIDKENSSGVAIDSDTAMAYRMIEGGFGHLEVTNLLTGETRKTLGLYIRDILN